MVKTGILICAYNEEKHIKKVVNETLKYVKDVIVVNDGSKDNTLKELKKTKAIILNHKVNKGKGEALKTGFKYAYEKGFDYLILMDGDGQHSPKDVPKFLKEIEKGCDLILGCRKKRHSDMPKRRRVSNFATSALISTKRRKWIKDTQCGFRAVRLSFLKNINLKRKSYDLESEMIIKMIKKGAKMKNLEVETIYGDETSTINPAKESFRFFRVLLRRTK